MLCYTLKIPLLFKPIPGISMRCFLDTQKILLPRFYYDKKQKVKNTFSGETFSIYIDQYRLNSTLHVWVLFINAFKNF